MSLSMQLFECSKKYENLHALSINNRKVSYSELCERSLKVASALLEAGAKENETIGIVGQRKVASYVGIIGILYAGCNYVPINPKLSKEKIFNILNIAGVRILVGALEDLEKLAPILEEENAPALKAIIQPEGKSPIGKGWIDEASICISNELNAPVKVLQKNLAYTLFTSGSTGRPKGVQVMHSNVLAYLSAMSTLWDLNPGFRSSQFHDFSFDPSVSDMFFTWCNGGELCVLPEEEILSPYDVINRERLTIWSSVPSIGLFMLKMNYLKSNSFPYLRISRFAGEPLPVYLAEAWRIAAPLSTVENHYGPTEATVDVSRYVYTSNLQKQNFHNGIVPIGKEFPGMEISIIDDIGNKVPYGHKGEIIFKGEQITKGYLNDQGRTDSVFVKFEWDKSGSVWYKSGDIGFYNVSGELECIGRKDNQIKFGGRRIELGEIEALLSRYPETRDSVVVPLTDANKIVTGLIAFTTSRMTAEEEVAVRIDSVQYLERIFFPKKFICISTFPLTTSGKIDRNALSDMATKLINSPEKNKI